jgi:hypothetical protein
MCVAPRYGAGKQNSGFRQNLSSDETTDRTTSHLTDETTSHSTRLSKDYSQVVGYRLSTEELLAGHPKDDSQVAGYALWVITLIFLIE